MCYSMLLISILYFVFKSTEKFTTSQSKVLEVFHVVHVLLSWTLHNEKIRLHNWREAGRINIAYRDAGEWP